MNYTNANTMSLIQIPISQIRSAKMQPKSRTKDYYAEKMATSLIKNGQLQPILVRRLPDGYELIVGHTRKAGAERAGWSFINAIVLDVSTEEAKDIFKDEAGSQQRLSSFHWLETFNNGVSVKRLNTKQGENIRICQSIWPLDLKLDILVRNNLPPTVGLVIKRFHGELAARLDEKVTPELSVLGVWAVEHKMIDWMRNALDTRQFKPLTVARAVAHNKPLRAAA